MRKGYEQIFFFRGSGRHRLLGVLFHPNDPDTRQTGIVYCHPFAEEQNMAHAVAVKACRAFSELGYPAMRFDLSGCGDSEGELHEITIPLWLEDVRAAVEFMRRETGVRRVALLGLRLGGGLASLYARDDPGIFALVLWEPVLDFALYARRFLRRAIASEIMANTARGTTVAGLEQQLADTGVVSVIGYPITRRLFDSFRCVSLQPFEHIPSCPVLVLSISQEERPSAQLSSYREALLSAHARASFEHVRAEPFWDRYWRWECPEVLRPTARWLIETAGRT